MLVPAMDAADVAKIERRAVCRLREDGRVDVGERPEFARLLEGQLAAFGVHGAGRQGGVAALQDFPDCRRNDPECRQAILRIARLDLFFDDADPGDPRGFGRELDRLFDPIGKVVELAVRVFRPGVALQHVDERDARGDDDRIPHIGMDVRSLRQFFPHAPHRASRRPASPRVERRMTTKLSPSIVRGSRSEALPDQGIAQQCRRFTHERGIG